MGVTIQIAPHGANNISTPRSVKQPVDILAILRGEAPYETPTRGRLLQSSFDNGKIPPVLLARSNGFYDAVTEAYNQHHHLVIRPEDIWIAILTQFSFYVNAHAEELRGSFVSHKGKKELEIVYGGGNRFTVDYADFATRMTKLLDQNVVDPDLRTWILPSFSTTTENDIAVSAIIMMGTLKAYFDYKCRIICGIPSVTLLGEKADYEDILGRLDKLADYGKEPEQFASMLKRVLTYVIRSFDEPQGGTVKDFWTRILKWNRSSLSGGDYWTGWAVAFCFWDADGDRLAKFRGDSGWSTDYDARDEEEGPGLAADNTGEYSGGSLSADFGLLPTSKELGRLNSDAEVAGFISVPVKIDDNGDVFMAEMLAGSVGISCSASEKTKSGLDTLQPCLGWFMYERDPPEGAVAECTMEEYFEQRRSGQRLD